MVRLNPPDAGETRPEAGHVGGQPGHSVNGKDSRTGKNDGRESRGRDTGDRKKPPAGGGGGQQNSRAPERTFEEVRYLKQLIENKTRIRVHLINNEEVSGTIEYYDQSFIRLTREPDPNLFIFKHEIKYLYEEEE